MNLTGIIAEYNPFHVGHKHHFEKNEHFFDKCENIICMSGNFSQRGEPCFADKFLRARAAVLSGAAIVFELPFWYATQSAQGFAFGGVSILDAVGCNSLSFGSECGNVAELSAAADALEASCFSSALKEALSDGLSFPAARHIAAGKEISALKTPNNILGIEYIGALRKIGSKMQPFTIERTGAAYGDDEIKNTLSSAAALRNEVNRNGFTPAFFENIPPQTHALYPCRAAQTEMLFPHILMALRRMSTAQMEQIEGMREGLEYRIKEASKTAVSYEDLMAKIKTKRYTRSRLSRLLLHCLMGLTKEDIAAANANPQLYARVLAVKKEALPLLSRIANASSIPIITKASEFLNTRSFTLDLLATDVYSTLFSPPMPSARDYTQKLQVVD